MLTLSPRDKASPTGPHFTPSEISPPVRTQGSNCPIASDYAENAPLAWPPKTECSEMLASPSSERLWASELVRLNQKSWLTLPK